MSVSADENRHISLSLGELERLCPVAKALSSPMRVKMIALLGIRSMNVNELAEALSLPVSTAALNVRQLEEAGLITTEIQPGIRGAMKLCSRRIDSVSMRLTPEMQDGMNALTLQLPIGSYSAADSVTPECGLVSDYAWIGETNMPRAFYHPDRFQAQMLWFSSGELEYRFSLGEIDPAQITQEMMEAELRTAGLGDVDLLIRTSGEVRLSNFLPWQSAYAEMVFDRVLWPDYDREAFLKDLREYASRSRRYGAVETPREEAAE